MIPEFISYHVIERPSFHLAHLRFGDINNKGRVGASALSRVVCG